MKKISVIIPVYNVEKYLAECLDSVLAQTYKNLEIICINDGSTDNSGKILAKYATRDPRIKILSRESRGPSVTRNEGILAATGDYINFIDSDDKLYVVDYYEKMIKALNDTGAEIACSNVLDSKRPHKLVLNYKNISVFKTMSQKIKGAKIVRRAYSVRWLIPREFLIENNLFFLPGRIMEDYIFSISLAYYAKDIASVPGAIYWYRRTPTGLLRSPEREQQRAIDKEFIYNSAVKFADERGFSLGFRRGFFRRLKMKWRGLYDKNYNEAQIQMPKITVIIPFYRDEKYVAECLDSVISQTYKNLEIICVNDQSIDNGAQIVVDYVARDARIKLLTQEHSGVSVARNTGMKEATGDYIHFMDADDKLWSKDFYEKLVDAAVRSVSDIAVADLMDEKYPGRPRIGYKRIQVLTAAQEKIKISRVVSRPAVWRFLFRRRFLADAGLTFNPKHKTGQDVMFSIPAVYFAKRIIIVPGAFYWYRRNPNGNIRSQKRGDKKKNLDIAVARSKFAKEHGINLGFKYGLKWDIKLWLMGALK